MIFSNPINLGIFFIPFFVAVMLFMYSGGIIDGLDGLAGGVFAIMFTGYGMIAFFQNQIDIAALCATIVGGLLAFLWFNIPPARFYMSETGSMALTVALSIVAFMTDTIGGGRGVVVLLIIGAPLVVTSLSVILQQISKKVRGKKIFLVAPLHHHFEALGWPSYKVTMRYWVISIVFCIIGVIFALLK
jgi:phospho-N-acetylmuramoyl-pentapeptide-transferase